MTEFDVSRDFDVSVYAHICMIFSSYSPTEMNMRWRMDTEQANTSHV